ncbi:MAG: ring-cleaving dioxygenase [Balneola sp.]
MKHEKGIHHISVLAGNPAENYNFYVNKLGMRLVKRSVNQDDPSTYHLFYGNEAAQPGSSITFFPWPRAHKGNPGTGESVNVAFKVPEGSEEFWLKRLKDQDIEHSDIFDVFENPSMRFQDPDGLEIDLIFVGDAKDKVSEFKSTVSVEHAIQGFWSTRLKLIDVEGTAGVLEDIFGFKEKESSGNQTRFETEANIGGNVIIETGEEAPGKGGRGIVHHVAFRAKDVEDLQTMREKVLSKGLQPTQVIDRHWFNSVYFKEPGGVLFEIATDGPGYDSDEDFEHLGEKLVLPPWLEPRRTIIENTLPTLDI